MSNPDANHPFHMGDLPNLVANRHGKAFLFHETSRITLAPGPLSILDETGSAIVVHANPDQGVPGAAGSGVAGGPRIACGVIKLDD
jgi:Cu-Zn family superoxide dismutase